MERTKVSKAATLFCLGVVLAACPSIVQAVGTFTQITSTTATAWGDYNNDGWTDLFGGNSVWTNNHNGTFTQTNPFSSLGNISLGDYNNDGYVDVYGYLGSTGPRLYTNNAGTGWTNDTAKFQTGGTLVAISQATTWGDFNRDGYLDTYVSGWCNPWLGPPDHDLIFTSNHASTFAQTWVSAPDYYGRGVSTVDFNEDGALDVYVSNYWLQQDNLYRNNGLGVLTNVASTYGANDGPGHTIGSAIGDFNNDGHFDIFASNTVNSGSPTSRFLQNQGPTGAFHFTDMGLSGITQLPSFASSTAADFDNDGYLDLYITTTNSADKPQLYRNNGNGSFSNVTTQYGLSGLTNGTQGSWGDYNNDGYLDLVTNGVLWRNPGGTNHWLKVKLQGGQSPSGLINGSAIGAQVRITNIPGLGTLTRQVEANTGEGMQNDMILDFGLGSYNGPVNMQIRWPNGSIQTINGVAVDQMTTLNVANLPPPGGLSFELVPISDPDIPDGYRVYDVMATTGTNLGVMEMVFTGDGVQAIYQHPLGGNLAPNPVLFPAYPELEFDSYITMPITHGIVGGAVDIQHGSTLVFDDQRLNVAWAPTGGSNSGPGTHQIARIALATWSDGAYTILGWQTGQNLNNPTTLQGTIEADPRQMILMIEEADDPEGHTPAGYTSYDFIALTDTNLGVMELVLDTDHPGDIYQDPMGGNLAPNPNLFPTFPELEFDSYVTMPVNHSIVGAAVDIEPGSSMVFDGQHLNVAWSPAGGANSGHGRFQIARVTVKDTATGSWTLMGWQTGGWDAVIWEGDIIPLQLPGDVNGDGFVGGGDLTVILTNWGMSGANWGDGDVAPYPGGDDFVGGADYTEVLTYWGTSYAPQAIPEPATIGLLLIGGLAGLLRRW